MRERNRIQSTQLSFDFVPVQSKYDIDSIYRLSRALALESRLQGIGHDQNRGLNKKLTAQGALVSLYSIAHYEKASKDPNVTMLIAKTKKGQTAGFIFVFHEGYIDKSDPKQQLNAFGVTSLKEVYPNTQVAICKQIGVDFRFQRIGLGTELYNNVIDRLKNNNYDFLCAAIVADGMLCNTRFEDGRGIPLFNEASRKSHKKRIKFKLLIEGFVYEDEIRAFESPEYLTNYPSGLHVREMYTLPLKSNLNVHNVKPPIQNRLETYL